MGNDTYRQLAEKSVRRIAEGGAPLPGLPGQAGSTRPRVCQLEGMS